MVLATRFLRCKKQCVNIIFSFSFFARAVKPFIEPTIEGAPSIHIPICHEHVNLR